MGELKESPRSGFIGAFADALKKGKSIADKVDVPVIGKLGQAMLGQLPEEVENWSYGNAPLAMPPSGTGGYIPVTKTGRAQGLADAVMIGAPMAHGALKGAANVADRASTAAVRKILGDATMTPAQVMDIAGSLMPSPVIKQSGYLGKNALYPSEFSEQIKKGLGHLPESQKWDAAGNLTDNMQAQVRALTNGDFLVSGMPQWKSKTKPFYAVGDNPEELASYALDRFNRSEKAIKAADGNTLIGLLKKQYGDDAFQLGKSTQSKSQYITHVPSGTKIRISDHDLPLHYDQPDVDLRIGASKEEMLTAINKAIFGGE